MVLECLDERVEVNGREFEHRYLLYLARSGPVIVRPLGKSANCLTVAVIPSRLAPAHPGEAAEVVVERDDGGVVLDGQGGQVAVVDQVAARARSREQPGQNVKVTGRRFDDDCGGGR